MNKAIIIGAGVGGMATAIRLAAKSYCVKVYEKNSNAGGKLNKKSIKGYRFDLGPSLFTRPDLILDLIELTKSDLKFPFSRLDSVCHYFYPNGKIFTAPSNPNDFANTLENQIGEPSANTLRFIEKAKEINRVAGKVFLENSLHKFGTYFKKDTLTSLAQIYKIDAFRTMNQANEKFFDTPEAVQLFNRYATYNGSDPYQTPATLNLISTLEMMDGAYFPSNGMYQITEVMYQTALKMGVQFHFNTGVKEITTTGNKATGIILENNDIVESDILVSNMDAYFTYKKLLGLEKESEKIEKLERSSSALIFYWGVKKNFDSLGLHNILFSEDYPREFNAIFKTKELFDDPTIYINITSKLNPTDAPKDCENWFVMINTPSKPELFTKDNIAKIKKLIISKIEKMIGQSLEPFIEVEDYLTPGLIEERTSSYLGALYGTASNHKFSAFFRPPNFSKTYKNLFFCGGSVHPGGGIPLCLLSAKIVADLIPDA